MSSYVKPKPARGTLPPEIERSARTIHQAVWKTPYKHCEGPMHYATGPYWGQELRRLANQWERQAAAARICAEFIDTGIE